MTGLYLFDSKIFDIIRQLKPSARGEFEITDVIDFYVRNNSCSYELIKGYWSDAGTFNSLNRASNLVKSKFYTEEDFWSDSEDFSELFKFPSKEDDYKALMEKLSELSKRQAQIIDYVLNNKYKWNQKI
jgi:dTDP-glucose pyrophosphorylase